MSFLRLPLRRIHTFPPRSTTFRSLYPQTTRVSLWARVAFRRDGTPRSWKKGAVFSTLFGAAFLLGSSGVTVISELDEQVEMATRAFNLVLLDSMAYPAVFKDHESDTWDSDVMTWSQESYKQVLAYYGSLLLCNYLKRIDVLPDDADPDEELVQYHQSVAQLVDAIIEFSWKFDCGDYQPQEKLLIRRIIRDTCVASHHISQTCRNQISSWHNRQRQITFNILASNTLQHLIPFMNQENIRPNPGDACVHLDEMVVKSLQVIVVLAKAHDVEGLQGLVRDIEDFELRNQEDYENLGR